MGEAIQKKIREVEDLITQALVLNLYGVENLCDLDAEEIARFYNGCGPAWLPDAARKKLTEYFAIFAPAFMLHDCRFEFSDNTRCGFNAANTELEYNLRKIAKAKYGFLNWRRYRALAAAEVLVAACERFGYSAWVKDEQSRVKECGSNGVASPTPSLPHSPTKLSLCLCASVLILLTGCYRSITVSRYDEYELVYRSVGLKTDVSKIEAEKMTNGTVRVLVEGVATDVSERNAKIVESSGTAIGNVAEKVIEGMK